MVEAAQAAVSGPPPRLRPTPEADAGARRLRPTPGLAAGDLRRVPGPDPDPELLGAEGAEDVGGMDDGEDDLDQDDRDQR